MLKGMVLSHSASAATAGGLRVHYSTAGRVATTVVLVHGWTCDESVWAEQVPALSKLYRVVTLDLPGHGKSDSPRDGLFSMDLFAHAIEAVRRAVEVDRIVLAGHSMGTPVVLRYAGLYPQHTAALAFVDGVILAPPNPNATAGATPPRGARFGGPEGRKNREGKIRGFFSASTTPAMQTMILEMMMNAPEPTAVGAMNSIYEPAGYTAGIPEIPKLGIYADPTPLATREKVLAHYPSAEYYQIPGTGHFLMIEKPDEFNGLLLAFLAKQKL